MGGHDGTAALVHYDCSRGLSELSIYNNEGRLIKRCESAPIELDVQEGACIRIAPYAHRHGVLVVVRGELRGRSERTRGEQR